MERFADGDIKDPYFQEKLINTFVNKIELYNDKIAITYNIGDGYLHDKHISICICPYLELMVNFNTTEKAVHVSKRLVHSELFYCDT